MLRTTRWRRFSETSGNASRARSGALLRTSLVCGLLMTSGCGAAPPEVPIVLEADDLQAGPLRMDGTRSFIVSERWMLARLRIEQQLEAELQACEARNR